jgi:hypothetical protein
MADTNLLDQPCMGLALAKVAATGTETERAYAGLAVAIDAMRRAREQIRSGDTKAADATLSDMILAHDFLLAPKIGKEH